MPIYIAFGANLSNGKTAPARTFAQARTYLGARGVEVVAFSGVWQSPAWPTGLGQPDYINAVAKVETLLSPLKLLTVLQACEAEFGRQRSVRNAARTLDLDILDYDGRVSEEMHLILPHPRMLHRGFVLFPLEQIAPDWVDPKNKRAITDWIARLPLADVAPLRLLEP